MNHMNTFITTRDPRRRATWLRLFGSDRLPVLSGRARWQPGIVPGRDVLAYDLAVGRLSQGQRDRFAAYVARRTLRDYRDVKAEMDIAYAWPIRARGCSVVEVEDSETVERPSLFVPVGSGLALAG